MSPSAVYDSPNDRAILPSKGPALALGSPSTAQDGTYQSLITDLQQTRRVDKQMIDRLVDGGMLSQNFNEIGWSDLTLCTSHYSTLLLVRLCPCHTL